MSDYKYKGQLSTLADMYLNAGDHEPLLEIERVYTQAAKVDEYEAKAKAFDAIYKEFREVEHDDISFGFFMHNFMNKYESGDSDG